MCNICGFDTLNHNLLIAKLGTYGFGIKALCYIKSYLRKQRVRVNNNLVLGKKLLLGYHFRATFI